MENLGYGFTMMGYGIGTTFIILILFYFMIKLLTKAFPQK